MADNIIDLRSDTLTRPSEAMRRAMADAEVGDDVFLEDPTVNHLQELSARMFGREAGLFVPSGTMGNLIAILAQTRPGQEVICEEAGHAYNYEMASMCSVAGVLPRVVRADDGIMTWESIRTAIRPRVYYRPQTALIALENTHNMAGGTVYPTATVREICGNARAMGIAVHMDGARIFNAAAYLKEDVAEMTRGCSSVQFCLSKGLGAPVGSVIVGDHEFIERCRSLRKMLGGGMRQAGVLAAAGIVALREGPQRLEADHRRARELAEQLAAIPGIEIDPGRVQTNIVIFAIRRPGLTSAALIEALEKRGVRALPVDASRVRMVTHLHIADADIAKAAEAVADVMRTHE